MRASLGLLTCCRRTFNQKVYVNNDFDRSGAPVFLYIGGEGPLGTSQAGPGMFYYSLAQKHGGAAAVMGA